MTNTIILNFFFGYKLDKLTKRYTKINNMEICTNEI